MAIANKHKQIGGGSFSIVGLIEDASPDTASDYLATYDASAGANRKVLLDNLGLGGGNAFTIIQPDAGTAPTASTSSDTLTLTSSDASITITGNSSTDTIDLVAVGGGTGDVSGPASSIDNAIARFDGTTGKIIQDYTSNAPTITDAGVPSFNDATYASSERIGAGSSAGGTFSTVLGASSTVSGSGVSVGYAITSTATGSTNLGWGTKAGTYCVAIGYNAGTAGSNTSVAIGGAAGTASGIGGTSIGYNAQANGQYATAIGLNTVASAQSLCIGGATTAGAYSICQGYNSTSGQDSVTLGWSLNSGDDSICIGYSSDTTTHATAIGHTAIADGLYSIAIGKNSDVNALKAMVVGGETATVAGQVIFGSSDITLSDLILGNGLTSATPSDISISGTGASGTNVAGADFILNGGVGTGTGAGGDLIFKTAPAGSTGSTLNTLTTKLTIAEDGILSTVPFSPGQFATGSLPTASSFEGYLAYDTTTNEVKFSDGSTWSAFGGGAGASDIDGLSDAISDGSSVFLGTNSGIVDNGTANVNTGVGVDSLKAVTTGAGNTGIGHSALLSLVSGQNNTGVGYKALRVTTGSSNVGIGAEALLTNIGGSNNIAIGKAAMTAKTTGNNNIAIGHQALSSATGGSSANTVAIGTNSGFLTSTGANNVYVGYQTGLSTTTGSDNIIIGYDIDIPSGTTNNYLNIGDTITGDVSNGDVATAGVFSPGQFATGSLPTASSWEGYIAYDTTTQTMKWSNGTTWATI